MKTSDNQFEIDQKIQFCLPDKKGKAHWFPGTIHGVRRYEDAATNEVQKITYLVDTGRDERIDEVHFDHRDREVTKRVNKLLSTEGNGIDDFQAALDAVEQDSFALPKSKPDVERIRQPEQIELTADLIRPV